MDYFFTCLIVSMKITAIYYSMFPGNILSRVRIAFANVFDKVFGDVASRIIQKPLWDCLPCMASVWTVIITWSIDINTIPMILVVCGINVIIESAILSNDD